MLSFQVGHSLGGASLLIYAVTSALKGAPDRIYRLILLTPAGFLKASPIPWVRTLRCASNCVTRVSETYVRADCGSANDQSMSRLLCLFGELLASTWPVTAHAVLLLIGTVALTRLDMASQGPELESEHC